MSGDYVYAGNCFESLWQYRNGYIGLALFPANDRDVEHDLRQPLPFADESVDRFQAEDVFEHIPLIQQPGLFQEVFRVLRPGGLFRLSLPDYRCDVLRSRCLYDAAGNIVFDPGGGGTLDQDLQVAGGGHLWFPIFETVRKIFLKSPFEQSQVKFLHYYDENGVGVCNQIDYDLGMVRRTPDHDERVRTPYRPMSIVVDAIK